MATVSASAKNIRIVLIWASVSIGILALFALMAGGAAIAHGRLYDGRIFPGVRVLGVRLDGLTDTEAQKAIHEAVDHALGNGLRFTYHDVEINVGATTVSTDAGDSRDLVHYDVDEALSRAMQEGRKGDWFVRSVEQARLHIVPVTIPADVTVDRAAITDNIVASLQDKMPGASNAQLTVDASSNPPLVHIQSEKSGVVVVTDAALNQLERQARSLDFEPIALDDRLMSPEITAKDLEAIVPTVQAFMARPMIQMTYATQTFAVPSTALATWVTVTGTRDRLEVTIDPTKFADSVASVAPGVELEAQNGSLVIKDGKIESFVSGTQGRAIDASATLQGILSGWPTSSTFPLVVQTVQGKLMGEDPERLGIHDLLGVGTSNFSGSPRNRIKNITHGAELVNGTIIQPGDTFSLLKALGPIDGEHKWLPELVIKGNETKPEFGGGLCQIGTTTFRAAMAAGMPIVERVNHSYRVRYYEPAGTDATIYDPAPDFRFLNDTSAPILINAYIKGSDAFFEFWGTNDGRKAAQTKPVLSNITSPPPMKLVETLDLLPGTKKCTEVAHAGADASFSYTVTYASGEEKKQVFQSHYRPWQAVCLIGVEKLSATSTNAVPLTP